MLCARLILCQTPVADVGHPVLFKQFHGVVAKAGMEIRQSTGFGGVGAQFKHTDPVVLLFGQCRVICGGEEGILDAVDEFAVLFGSGASRHPFRVIDKGLPGGGMSGTVGKGEKVNQLVLCVVRRHKVTKIGHAVLCEQFDSMVAKPCVECIQLAGGRIVHTHLKQPCIRFVCRGSNGGQQACAQQCQDLQYREYRGGGSPVFECHGG